MARRMRVWHDQLEAGALLWRVFRGRIPGVFSAAPGRAHPSQATRVAWSELEVVPPLARQAGLEPLLYVSVFDEGWPLAPPDVREHSHHNAMHGKDVAWQSAFSLAHPEFTECDRDGARQWGVLSLAYPEVRAHFVHRFTEWMRASDFAGLFLCLRSQSKPADHADQFGFSQAVRADVLARQGRDIHREPFDVQAWRDLRGEHLTDFLRELRTALDALGRSLWLGTPRGDVIGPPLGNTTLDWRTCARERLIDALVVNQNSSQCPSMWHQLWPMHRGTGYVQNYLTGEGLPPLEDQVLTDYDPVLRDTPVRLFIARQWDARAKDTERRLGAQPGVSGLVFSSFRHDNPAAVARNDWRF
ncbi:MAG: hypothetical protein FJW23_07100 [Acidimicrobiia bacterium]|nr:hypothetical protein [Acidimicrobiia bacterium]